VGREPATSPPAGALISARPVVTSVLFALYHFVSPWQFFARALGPMPLIYFVWRRRNVYVAIVVRCGLNTLGSLLVLPQLLNVL
jgi:membrane protease YdiL (CAAX protease family)